MNDYQAIYDAVRSRIHGDNVSLLRLSRENGK